MSARYYDYTIVKGENSPVVDAVVNFLNGSYLRIETAVGLLNALSLWGAEFTILCEGDETATYSNEDFDGDVTKEEWEDFCNILKEACPHEYVIGILNRAHGLLHPREMVFAHEDVIAKSVKPSEAAIEEASRQIREAIDTVIYNF